MPYASRAVRALLRLGGACSLANGLPILLVSGLLFLGAVGTLLWKTQRATAQREEVVLEQFRLDTVNLASNLAYFFQERHNDLNNLAESRPVETYFENVALGMSPRYGLLASVQEIDALLQKTLKDKLLARQPIFTRVTLKDAAGAVIATLEQARTPAAPLEGPASFPAMEVDCAALRWSMADRGDGPLEVVVDHPVVFRGKTEGAISARLSLDTVLHALVNDARGEKQSTYCLGFGDNVVACPPQDVQGYSTVLRGAPGSVVRIAGPGATARGSPFHSGGRLGMAAPVEGTPFTVLRMVPETVLLGAAAWPLSVLAGLLCLVLLAALALFTRVNAERMVLNARVEEQHRSQGVLRKRMEEFSTLFNALPGYAFYKDPDGVYVTANALFCDAVGLPLEAIVGKRDDAIFPQYLAAGYMRDDQLLLSGRQDFHETEETILHRGREVQLVTRKLVLRHSDGTLGGLIGLGFDLTEKKRIEEELRWANDRMEERIRQRTEELALTNSLLQGEIAERRKAHQDISLILDAISAILIVVDGQGRVQRWSKAARQSFSLPVEAVAGREFVRLPLTWDGETVIKGIAACRETGQAVKLANIWYERPDGADGFLVVTISPLADEGADVSGYLLLGDDITDVRFLEAQLSQAAKLEAIGQLAAGIAHEINTPTQYVGDSVTFLKDAFTDLDRLQAWAESFCRSASPGTPEDTAALAGLLEAIDAPFLKEEVPRTIARIFEGIERIRSIVLAMKRFSYTSGDDKRPVDIRNAIENTLVISRNEWKYLAEVTTDFDPGLPEVFCLSGDINQVFLNIIVNAAHAIGDVVRGTSHLGRIAISTRQDGAFAEIRIQDTGPGIPEEVGHKVFNLFFTTKEVGKGTGQGLAIAYDIVVNKHGGSISFTSEPGQGTTFLIRLPIHG